jgi:hypothetical protein
MLCFHPTTSQWKYLKSVRYPNNIFDIAYNRYKKGELEISDSTPFKKENIKKELGQPLILKKDYPDITDDQARAILQAHIFINKEDYKKYLKTAECYKRSKLTCFLHD